MKRQVAVNASVGVQFLSEVVGTAMLLLLGGGVVATAILTRSKGLGGGWLLINFGWGIAVFAGVSVSYASGAFLNPAVVLGVYAAGGFTQGFGVALLFILAELIGAFIGAVLVWLAFKRHFDEETQAGTILGVFSTGPEIRSYAWNLVTEIIGTFVLVFVVLAFGRVGDANTPSPAGLAALGALPVALLVVGIGASLGGPTGYAINPARDLGPRIAHAVLPIPNKGGSDWAYSWVPIVGPIIGGVVAGLLARVLLPVL
jgi:glycerol uptake facilitator protein